MSRAKRPRKVGRPPKAPADRKLQYVKIYLTDAQKDRLRQLADAARLKMSDYLRSFLDRPARQPKRALDRDSLRQLAGIGNNLNQLTRYMHRGGELHAVHEELIELLDQFQKLLHDRQDQEN